MYLDGKTLLFWIAVIAAIAGFVGFERGKKVQRKHNEYWIKARGDLARMVDALPQDDKDALAAEIAATRGGFQ